MDSVSTPLKVIEKDTSTGEYIVRMSPDYFDSLSANQGQALQSRYKFCSFIHVLLQLNKYLL